jgi:hypothetical protein
MIHHIVTWPFKKINDWLRAHYQNKQLKEQSAILQQQLLLDTTPEIDVSVRVVPSPDPPRRTDIPIVDVVVRNYGGTAHITKGAFWITLSHRPSNKEGEKYIVDTLMPKGKEERFYFNVILQFFSQVESGKSVLKFHYDLQFEGADRKPQHRKRSCTYDLQTKGFISDK